MSQLGVEPKPARRRAGLLSALTRLYNDAHDLMNKNASKEEIENLITKLDEQCMKYLDSHDSTLEDQPEREQFLVNSHVLNEQRHRKIVSQLAAYLEDGSKPDDLESLHANSLFSLRSNAKRSVAQSCPANFRKPNTASHASQARSVTASETRVQAKLAKHKFAQKQAEQGAHKQKIEFERRIAREHRELDKRREEAEARERQVQLEAQQKQEEVKRQQRELEQRQREIREEAELHKQELESAMQLEKQKNEMENLQTELRLREKEEIRDELGSDYDSDSDRDDVTSPKEPVPKPKFQLESEQTKFMQRFLQQITAEKLQIAPAFSDISNPVDNWMCDPADDIATPAPRDTLQIEQSKNCGYVPPVTGLQKGHYSGVFSDKLRSDRLATAEFRNQNV